MNETEVIRCLDSFAALRELAPRLYANQGGIDIFHTAAWFENLASHGFDSSAQLQLMLFQDSGNATSVCLPLVGGRTLTSLSNYYSSLYGPITCCHDVPLGIWQALCRTIRQQKPRWPVVSLCPLDADGSFCHDILTALRAEGYWADTYFCFGNWYLEVAHRSSEEYFEGLHSKLRNTIERGRRKLEREGEWDISIHRHPGATLDAAIIDFETVYRRSWKPLEAHRQFIGGLCRMAAAQGWLRLGILKLQGEPIAAQLWLVKDDKALIFKLAYDQRHTRFSAGSILTAALMREVIDGDKVSEIDYLTGDDAYKRDWMSHRRERIGIVAFNPGTIRGLLAAGRHFLWKAIKCHWATQLGNLQAR